MGRTPENILGRQICLRIRRHARSGIDPQRIIGEVELLTGQRLTEDDIARIADEGEKAVRRRKAEKPAPESVPSDAERDMVFLRKRKDKSPSEIALRLNVSLCRVEEYLRNVRLY